MSLELGSNRHSTCVQYVQRTCGATGDGVVSDEGSNTGGMKGMKGIKAVVPADDIIAGVWTEEARRQLGWAKGLGVFKGVE